MSSSRNIDYATYARRGFLLGAGLFALGVLGEVVGHAVVGNLPAWNETLLTNMEGAGILIGLLAPLFFGIVLPLTD